MAASTARIRLGLYGIVLIALVAAAIIALFSIGDDGRSNAADRTSPPVLSTGPVSATSSTETSPVVTTPSSTPVSTPASTPASSSPSAPTTTKKSPSASESLSSSRPVSGSQKASKAKVYIVKRGDNLTVIAAWFHVRGFEPLYAWNKTVIGQNPDLIFPGQKIIVAPGGKVSVSNG